MKKLVVIQIFIFWALMAFSQSKMSLQTQHFLSVRNEQMQVDKQSELQRYLVQSENGQQYISAYIHLTPGADITALEALGVEVGIRMQGIITARIPVERIEEVSGMESVKYVQIGTAVKTQMDEARELANVDALHTGQGLDMPYTGEGVVVGIIDSGFEYGHVDFYNSDRTELRVKRVWDQNGQGSSHPSGFNYGVEYKTESEILAAPADRNGTHGSHVAGIAAGADKANGNTFYGVATDAELVLVRYAGVNGGDANFVQLSEALKYIYDYADEAGKPCVINLSLGSHDGPHDGTSSFDIIADGLQGEGKLLVGAAGNDANKDCHVYKTFESAESAPLKVSIIQSFTQGIVDIWADEGMECEVQLAMTDNDGNVLKGQGTKPLNPASGDKSVVNISSGSLSVYSELSPLNNKPHASGFFSVTGGRQLALIVTPKSPGTVHVWCVDATAAFRKMEGEAWTNPTEAYTLCEIGGTGKQIITVGASVSKNSYTLINGKTEDSGFEQYHIAPFSGNGPSADGRMKPDVVAPGSFIASAVQGKQYVTFERVVKEVEWNGKTYRYGMMSGTSMATPLVTGVLATWLQANDKLTPENVREVLRESSVQDEYTGTIPDAGSNVWGYGKIDAWNGVKKVISLASGIENTVISTDFSVIPSADDSSARVLLGGANKNVHIYVLNMNGQQVGGQYVGNVTAAQEVVLPMKLEKGIYIVRLVGDDYSGSKKVALM